MEGVRICSDIKLYRTVGARMRVCSVSLFELETSTRTRPTLRARAAVWPQPARGMNQLCVTFNLFKRNRRPSITPQSHTFHLCDSMHLSMCLVFRNMQVDSRHAHARSRPSTTSVCDFQSQFVNRNIGNLPPIVQLYTNRAILLSHQWTAHFDPSSSMRSPTPPLFTHGNNKN
jgi:hypothetical protein